MDTLQIPRSKPNSSARVLRSSTSSLSKSNEMQPLTFHEKVERAKKRKVKKTRHPKLPQHRIRKGVYDMTAPIRGRCVIFANSVFKNCQNCRPLHGYEIDSKVLERVFTELKFKVTVFKNKSIAKIKKELTKLANNKIRDVDDKPNAFVAIILSHGNKYQVLGAKYESDTKTPQEILREAEIFQILNNENCKNLQDRPKLIFIQACQGDKEDYGVDQGPPTLISNPNDNEIIGNATAMVLDNDDPLDESNDAEGEISATPALSNRGSTALNHLSHKESEKIPTESDMMICYSTVSGYKSFVRLDGSVFGIALANALIEHAHDTDLQRLMNLISSEMKLESTLIGPGQQAKQIPEVTYKGWTKQLFFNPGYPRPPISRKRPPQENAIKVIRTEGSKKAKTTELDQSDHGVPTPTKPAEDLMGTKTKESKTNLQRRLPGKSARKKMEAENDPRQRKITDYKFFLTPKKSEDNNENGCSPNGPTEPPQAFSPETLETEVTPSKHPSRKSVTHPKLDFNKFKRVEAPRLPVSRSSKYDNGSHT